MPVRGLLTEDDEPSLSNGNHPVSAEPSTTGTGSSNPTPRTNLPVIRESQGITPSGLSPGGRTTCRLFSSSCALVRAHTNRVSYCDTS